MENLRYPIKLNMENTGSLLTSIRLKQGDSAIIFVLRIFKNGQNVFSADDIPSIVFNRPDGSAVVGECSVVEGQYTYKILGNELQYPGQIRADVKFDIYTETESSTTFLFECVKDTLPQNIHGAGIYVNSLKDIKDYFDQTVIKLEQELAAFDLQQVLDAVNFVQESADEIEDLMPEIRGVTGDVSNLNSNLDALEFGEVAGEKNLANLEDVVLESSGMIYSKIPVRLPIGTYTLSWSTTNTSGEVDIGLLTANNTTAYSKTNIPVINGSLTFTTSDDVVAINLYSHSAITIKNVQIEKGSSATPYKPYIPSVKMLADENAQQSTEAMDLKMLGWSVPSECPIQNEVSGNQFIQRVGRVDLGSLNWVFVEEPNRFNVEFKDVKFVNIDMPITAYSNTFTIRSFNDAIKTNDKCISVYGSNGASMILVAMDNSYTDATTFKNAMQGVYLYYELAEEKTIAVDGNEAVTKVNESLDTLGKCKNLLNPTLQTTLNGVTCTNNGDGTYTLNGTASERAVFYLLENGSIKLEAGTYKFIFDKDEVSTGLGIKLKNKGWISTRTITLTSSDELTDLWIDAQSGITFNNAIVKPMITKDLTATYDDFVPYTGDGDTLTHDVAEIKNDLAALDEKKANKDTVAQLKNDLTAVESNFLPRIKALEYTNTFSNDSPVNLWGTGSIPYTFEADGYLQISVTNGLLTLYISDSNNVKLQKNFRSAAGQKERDIIFVRKGMRLYNVETMGEAREIYFYKLT